MIERIVGVLSLNINTYEAIEHDQSATMQAGLVVVIAALLSGIGSGGAAALFTDASFFGTMISGVLSALIAWVMWSFLTYVIGVNLFGGEADMGEMLRVVGFAMAPQALGIVPCIGWLVGLVWSLATLFIAVRQGLDIDNTKTAITIFVCFFAYLVIAGLLGSVLSGFAFAAS